MRQLTPRATENIKILLDQLLTENGPKAYQDTMYSLGRHIGQDIARAYANPNVEIYIACTVEDADYLAKGIIEELEEQQIFQAVKLACFWNERTSINGFSVAPILKRYREPSASSNQFLVIIKSIISGACVVKTNLTSLIQDLHPTNILIAAPAMLKGAEQRLAKEFTKGITKRFQYLTYAIDDEKYSDNNVKPGIGGNVYNRLGLGDQKQKNQYIPIIVKQRRIRFANSAV